MPDEAKAAEHLNKAIRLFEFLTRVQQQRTRPVRDVDSYVSRSGDVVWLGKMPHDRAINGPHLKTAPDAAEPILVIDRVPRTDPPPPPPDLADWLVPNSWIDPGVEPELRDSVTRRVPGDDGEPATLTDRLEQHPEIEDLYLDWAQEWASWSEAEAELEPIRKLYRRVFRMADLVTGAPEELELVAAVGLMTWDPQDHEPVRRHLITVQCEITFDDQTGRITAIPDPDCDGMELELDMLDVSRWPTPERLDAIRHELENYTEHLLHRERIGLILQRLCNSLDPSGRYVDELDPGEHGHYLVVSYSPALILRRRSTQQLLRVYEEILAQLRDSAQVPKGVLQLVEIIEDQPSSTDGLDVERSRSVPPVASYLPLPANDQQRQIIERVSVRNHTVVQGPPGTGKTHTIANLLSHLLAQGQRVLITAQTDRALRELRDKLPDELERLCVSVVGQERSDLADLKVAVDQLARRAAEHDEQETTTEIDRLEHRLGELKRERSRLHTQLLQAREAETLTLDHGGYRGTLAQIAQQHARDAEQHGWIERFAADTDAPPPLTNAEILEWFDLTVDETIQSLEPETKRRLIELDRLPSADEFDKVVRRETQAQEAASLHQDARHHDAYEAVRNLQPDARTGLRERIRNLGDTVAALTPRQEQWMGEALADVYAGRSQQWTQRFEDTRKLVAIARAELEAVGLATTVRAPEGNLGTLEAQAKELRTHLGNGGKWRGAFGVPKPVKQAASLLSTVLVNDLPPTTTESLDRFLGYIRARRALDALSGRWPPKVEVPVGGSLWDLLGWHDTEVTQLGRVIALGRRLQDEERQLRDLGIPVPDWSDLNALRRFSALVEAAAADDAAELARQPLDALQARLVDTTRWEDEADAVDAVADAVLRRDPAKYRVAVEHLRQLHDIRERCARRDSLCQTLKAAVPRLVGAVDTGEFSDARARLERFEEAWQWLDTARWIDQQNRLDFGVLQRQVAVAESSIGKAVTRLTVALAWGRAVGRLGLREQQNLKSYALAVRQVGKGTGKYAAHRRSQARIALRECRSAVPAWVMPLYRIAETLSVERDMFDVVIIDEASQAGIEATFLFYLAPKIVVVGDDKQVSPSGIGLDRQQLIDLRQQFLSGFDHAYTWENPETSFFDQARLRSPDVITLREHFRCVPEIIGFSNRIAYEPDNVPLIPLRQYGRDRLEPIRTVFVEDGYTEGSSSNLVNPPEVEHVVDTILKCCSDPAYDGKTMGVISLTGASQADRIEQALLLRMDAAELRAREMRCGDAATFQGSERDVVFLSMVAAREQGRRYAPLTHERYVQRFNVAASRAKDQLWLFHSLTRGELSNREDMRFQLLDYCATVTERGALDVGSAAGTVPDDVRVDPFESLFEQHVYNQIRDRGYIVQPQYEVYGYRIDLVVIGGSGRLAVECDGDQWHGADRFEHDLGRQRELERCKWTFFRVRGSTYYRNPYRALEPLWGLLDQLEIYPATRSAPAAVPVKAGVLTDASVSRRSSQVGAAPAPAEGVGSVEPSSEVDSLVGLGSDAGSLAMSPGPESHKPRPVMAPPASVARADRIPRVDTRSREASSVRQRGDSRRDSGQVTLKPYRAWAGKEAPDPRSSGMEALASVLVEIVDAEGPVTADRVFRLIIRSAGFNRVTTVARRPLNKALHRVRDKLDVAEYESPETQWPQRVIRLRGRPSVVVRELGPRDLYEVPLDEISALLVRIAAENPRGDQETLNRQLLDLYGLTRLTSKADRYLRAAHALPPHSGESSYPLVEDASGQHRHELSERASEPMPGSEQPMPNTAYLMWPTLQAIRRLGGSAGLEEITRAVIDSGRYTEEDLERRLRRQPDDRVPAIDRFVQWACSNLARVGALTRNAGVWSVTSSGRTVAEEELPDLLSESRRRREEGRRWRRLTRSTREAAPVVCGACGQVIGFDGRCGCS